MPIQAKDLRVGEKVFCNVITPWGRERVTGQVTKVDPTITINVTSEGSTYIAEGGHMDYDLDPDQQVVLLTERDV